jgi:hypothetical protein
MKCGMRRHAPITEEIEAIANDRFLSTIVFFLDETFEELPYTAQARSIHWSPYDRVGVVNADP